MPYRSFVLGLTKSSTGRKEAKMIISEEPFEQKKYDHVEIYCDLHPASE
jgi:hypothetical protein